MSRARDKANLLGNVQDGREGRLRGQVKDVLPLTCQDTKPEAFG